jgi:hypothetical protein
MNSTSSRLTYGSFCTGPEINSRIAWKSTGLKSKSKKSEIMGKIMNIMFGWFNLTCQDTSPLISEMMDHKVSFIKRLKIKIHLSLCKVCLYYKKQLEVIRNLSKNLGREDFPVNRDETLPEESKQKIKEMIKANK